MAQEQPLHLPWLGYFLSTATASAIVEIGFFVVGGHHSIFVLFIFWFPVIGLFAGIGLIPTLYVSRWLQSRALPLFLAGGAFSGTWPIILLSLRDISDGTFSEWPVTSYLAFAGMAGGLVFWFASVVPAKRRG